MLASLRRSPDGMGTISLMFYSSVTGDAVAAPRPDGAAACVMNNTVHLVLCSFHGYLASAPT